MLHMSEVCMHLVIVSPTLHIFDKMNKISISQSQYKFLVHIRGHSVPSESPKSSTSTSVAPNALSDFTPAV